MRLRFHAFEPASRANGPGLRAVVWFQGCTLGCPGCLNPATHPSRGGHESDTESPAAEILAIGDQVEGISISGGEPFQQPAALLDLLSRLAGSQLSRLVFTGYTMSEINRLPLGPEILDHLDVLIAGRYAAAHHVGHGLLGSSNQNIYLLTSRYTLGQFSSVPRRELILHTDGTTTATGVAPWWPGT
jgi:anaerobic ribonucleoside-triphosphate reductase activating protein